MWPACAVVALSAALIATGCGPGGSDGQQTLDAGASDARLDTADTNSPDIPDTAQHMDVTADAPDGMGDATAPGDAADAVHDVPDAADDGPEPLGAAVDLPLEQAVIEGGDRRGACVHLHPGGTVTWTAPVDAAAGLNLNAASWRGDGRNVVVNGVRGRLHHLWGQLRKVALTQERPPPDAGYGIDYAPRRERLSLAAGGSVTVAADGELDICAAALVPPDAAVPDPLTAPAAAALPEQVVDVPPCGEDCDDGAAISAAIAEADGPVTVRLEGSYRLRTPVAIRRGDIALVGPAGLTFDPAAQRNWGAAIEITGPGTGPAIPLTQGVLSGDHTLLVDPAEVGLDGARFVFVQSDDHGEVPALCVGGRDVERQFRHHNFLSEATAADGTVGLERALPYDLPLSANPTVAAVALLEHVSVRDLTLIAHCPEAADIPAHTQSAAQCANPYILGVSAIRAQWAWRPEVRDVHAHHFGRFGVDTTQTLEAQVIGGGMTLPADYGGGGAGYGVHAIRASRTLVFGYDVVQARHAVVADFGSTETQIVASTLSICTLSAIDVHGEASYDTLALGNRISRSNGSIIVGGGGREVHCNDGPRHYFVGNEMRTGGLVNAFLTDYSSQVFFHHNTIVDSGYSLIVSAGTQDVVLERNALVDARAGHVLATDALQGTDRITLRDNLLDGDPARWVTAEDGITVAGPD